MTLLPVLAHGELKDLGAPFSLTSYMCCLNCKCLTQLMLIIQNNIGWYTGNSIILANKDVHTSMASGWLCNGGLEASLLQNPREGICTLPAMKPAIGQQCYQHRLWENSCSFAAVLQGASLAMPRCSPAGDRVKTTVLRVNPKHIVTQFMSIITVRSGKLRLLKEHSQTQSAVLIIH